MSRGPGRVMRAALAELDEHDGVEAFSVAVRAFHDDGCDCGERVDCWRFWPNRAQLVSARRALHTLARRGVVELSRRRCWGSSSPDPLYAVKRCQDIPTHTQATVSAHGGGG